jgi:hypothetical protein
MIRFRTIDPAEAETPPAPPLAKSSAAPAAEVYKPETATGAARSKGLTRKTPLRARKDDLARRDRD